MGGDIKGGGLTYYKTDLLANSALMYGEGLRVPNTAGHAQLDSLNSTVIYGKRKYFERGVIIHLRSNATQYMTWHALFGGFRKSVVERWFINYYWKFFIKRMAPVYGVLWTIQVLGHRDYDNNAYAYFYFSD